jgi:hypothetical protein
MAELQGIKLAELFYREAVRPILDVHFAGLWHSAALIGHGSEVLGFDTEMSRDHHWGPRAMVFLSDPDFAEKAAEIREIFSRTLPRSFHGYSTNFSLPDHQGVQLLEEAKGARINHRVELFAIDGYFKDYLGFDLKQAIDVADWLTFPQQKLRTIACGAIFHDDLGLADVCGRFSFYPRDIWLYQLAAHWSAIAQEEPFVGRTGILGDEIGSAVIAARLVQQLMSLCFLMERQYSPYSKWFGTAFSKLACAGELTSILKNALNAQVWQEREGALSAAYEFVARTHNRLKITAPLPANVSPFFGRPFRVIHGGGFANAIREQIQDERVRCVPTNVGGIDVFSSSTNLLEATGLRGRLKALYD